MTQSQEKSNNYKALAVSAGIHSALLLFLFYFALHTPVPPLEGGSGVVLNLGYVDEGTGELQTLNEASDSKVNAENKPSEPQPDNTSVTESVDEQKTDDQSKTGEENLVTGTDEESTVTAEPDKKTEPEKKEPVKLNKEPEKEPKENKPTDAQANAKSGKVGAATDGGNNNGDKVGKTGDQGNPQGKVDARALYGNPGEGGNGGGGSGGGASLDLAGWNWDGKPRVNEDSDENGRIVYQITIDENGEMVDIKAVESTVSASVEKIYRKEVEKLTFSKTDNKVPAPRSKGRITFIIRSR